MRRLALGSVTGTYFLLSPPYHAGDTPLHLACEDDKGDAARLLVEHGANMRAVNKGKRARSRV